MTKLSPSAQAVLNVALTVYDDEHLYVATMEKHAGMIAAAAIKAAADQVVPEYREHQPHTLDEQWRKVPVFDVRNRLLTIASELESQ